MNPTPRRFRLVHEQSDVQPQERPLALGERGGPERVGDYRGAIIRVAQALGSHPSTADGAAELAGRYLTAITSRDDFGARSAVRTFRTRFRTSLDNFSLVVPPGRASQAAAREDSAPDEGRPFDESDTAQLGALEFGVMYRAAPEQTVAAVLSEIAADLKLQPAAPEDPSVPRLRTDAAALAQQAYQSVQEAMSQAPAGPSITD